MIDVLVVEELLILELKLHLLLCVVDYRSNDRLMIDRMGLAKEAVRVVVCTYDYAFSTHSAWCLVVRRGKSVEVVELQQITD